MSDSENKTTGKPIVEIPDVDTDELDESGIYGDDTDLPARKKKKKTKNKASADDQPEEKSYSKVAGSSGKRKKKPKKDGRLAQFKKIRSLEDLMRFFNVKPKRIFGKETKLWPIFILGAVLVLGYGVFLNNSNLSISNQSVTIVGLPEELENYKIVVLSDLNGRRFGDAQGQLLRSVNSTDYNAIFCLGDMVGASGDPEPFWEFLDGLKHPERVYFICGDSDPGPFVETPRNISGTLAQIVLEDWIVGAIKRGANYVDGPVKIALKETNLWISPTTMLNLETVSTVETWKDQAEQEKEGVLAGLTEDYNSLPKTDYRYRSIQKLYDAERSIAAGDIHICLSHERPSEDFIYISETHDPENDRYLPTPELILAGHYCNGVWRLPFIGALYVPDSTLPHNGWFPEQSSIGGLSSIDNTQLYITAGLSYNSAIKVLPFRLFNSPQVSVITLTSKLPENMLTG